MTQVRVDKLTALGAIPERTEDETRQVQEEATKNRTWDQQYRELKAFTDEYGHYRVPTNVLKWKSLSEWLRNQKQCHNEKRLSLAQLKSLAAVGVVRFQDDETKAKGNTNNSAASSRGSGSIDGKPASAEQSNRKSNFSMTYYTDQSTPESMPKSPTKKARTDTSNNRIISRDWFPCRVHVVQMDLTTLEIGFVVLSSRAFSTLADARKRISETLILDQYLDGPTEFEFHLPLGPISEEQESTVGPMCPFLKHYDPRRAFTEEGDVHVFIMKRGK